MNEKRQFATDFEELCIQNHDKNMIRFVLDGGSSDYSYARILSYTRRCIHFYRSHGLKKGSTIVSVMPNSVECIVAFFAAIAGGYHFAPLSCQISEREFHNWAGIVHPGIVIKKAGVGEFRTDVEIIECRCDGDLSWLPEEEDAFDPDGVSKLYLMTSGTTGTPKAMQIDANRLWNSGKAFAGHYGLLDKSVRFWNYLPMSYLGGLYNLALIPLACGGSFVISEPFSGKTILNFWTFVESNGIDALWIVPSIMQGLLKIANLIGKRKSPKRNEKIRIAFLGTAPVQLEQKEQFEETFGIRLFENYALSESTFLTAEDEGNVRYREQGSVGCPLPYAEIKLIPIEGASGVNMIWIKTPYLFDGYLDECGNVDLELDENGFFNTKDLGFYNADHVLVLAGRNRDIIKKGGLFVSLVEIENVVRQYPNCEEAAAVPVHSDFYGESFALCVIFKAGTDETSETEKLHAWLLDNIVNYKMPEKIFVYKDFPKTASGKIQKSILAKEVEVK